MRNILILLAATILYTGCEAQNPEGQDTVFDPQVKALEKARAVEETVQQNADRTREAVESIGQEGHPQGEE